MSVPTPTRLPPLSRRALRACLIAVRGFGWAGYALCALVFARPSAEASAAAPGRTDPASAPGPADGAPLPKSKIVTARAATEKADRVDRLSHDIEKIERAIGETKQMMRNSLDAPYLPDLIFHLAELYVERSRLEHGRALAQQDLAGGGLGGDGSMVVQVTKHLAVETYDKILADFPDYEHRDQVLFFKGHELRELGDWEAMAKTYDGLIDHFPRSKWAQRARLTLADYYFDKGDEEQAEPYYQNILLQPESRASVTARYRIGWIRLHRQKYKEALDLFKDAILLADARPQEGFRPGGRGIDVRREALLAMAWPYAETRKAAGAFDFFRPLADSQQTYIEVLRKLASRYTIKDQPAAAAFVLREVVILSNDPEVNLDAVPAIVNAVGALPAESPQRYGGVDRDEWALTKTFQQLLDRPPPVKHRPGAPQIDEAKIHQEYELAGRDLATRAQQFAQAANDRRLEAKSAVAYDRYLDAFPAEPTDTKVRLNRAGALFDAQDYYPAGRRYEAVALSQADTLAQADVYDAIVAYWRALDADAKHRASDPDRHGTLDRLQLLRAREGLKQLGSFYIKKWPNDGKVPEVRFNVARMVYQQGDFARAAVVLAEFVRDYPSHKEAPTAGRLALDALYKLEDLQALATLAESFAKNQAIADAAFRAEAARLAEAAHKRKIEFAVLDTPEADFSSRIMGEFEKHKGSREGEDYLYAGFSKYKAQGDIANTNLFGDKLIGAYPQSKRTQEVMATMGAFAAHLADFERAAALYEEYHRRYPKAQQAGPLLRNAAEIRRLLGQGREAQADLTQVMAEGSAADGATAAQKLLEMYAGQASWPQLAAAAANLLATQGQGVAPCFYAGLAAQKQNELRVAAGHFTCAARGPARGDGDEALMARAAFELGRVQQATFLALNFTGAGAAEATLKQKLALLQATETAYLAAIHTGDSRWGLAATYEMSRLYRQFGDFVVTAPAPANVSAEQYKAALGEQAEPYFDKAKQTLAACGQKAQQVRLLSPFGRACVAGESDEVDDNLGTPFRSASAQDPRYQADLAQSRNALSKNVKNVDVLKSMARRAMAAGDWHYARLVLSSISEIAGGRAMDAWMGLILWHLGEPQEAFPYLERARRQGNDIAALNAAGLLYTYGYKKSAKQAQPERSRLEAIDLHSYEVHPLARAMLQGAGGN